VNTSLIIISYTFAISSADSASQPEVIFTIFGSVCCLSPGLILSGEKPTLKSFLNLIPTFLSKIGTQSSSVQPG